MKKSLLFAVPALCAAAGFAAAWTLKTPGPSASGVVSLEKAEHMLSLLGIELAGERETYYTDHEYAASLLGVSTEELDRQFGNGRTEAAVAQTSAAPAIVCRGAGKSPAPQITVITVLLLLAVLLLTVWLFG